MWNTLFGESTSLFDEFNWLSREMDRLFEPMGIPALRTAGSGFPAVNVATEEDKVHVLVFAPSIDPSALDVSILGNVLTVQGRREMPAVPEGAQIWVKERLDGRFVRTMFESAVVRQAWRLREVQAPDVTQLRELTAADLEDDVSTAEAVRALEN